VAFAAGPVKLPATSQAACFDENGVSRACSGTGEDGEKQAGVAWPAARFSDNNNGTVTDKLTGLIWSKHANAPSRALATSQPNSCPNAEASMTWLQALDFVACLNAASHAGSSDWRLPNLNELESMVNPGVADTTTYLNANGFGLPGLPSSMVQPGRYWSSTSDASGIASQSADAAWDVDLAKGDFPVSSLKNDLEFLPRAVWPVRGKTATPAQVRRTGQTLCFDEVGEARPCAGTGEDGEKLAGADWPTPRFNLDSAGTFAVDKLTGLIWPTATLTPGPDACADTGLLLTWQQALDHVACLNTSKYLGRNDWRLPNRKELHSLADYSTGAPALPAGHPFDDPAGFEYWSSTTDLSSPADAWTVSIFDGSLSSAVKAQGVLPAWPVRGPDMTPSITTASPNPGIYNGSVSVVLASSETETKIYYTTDGSPVSTASPVYSAPIILKPSATTTYNVQFFSVDSLGNIEEVKSSAYTIHVNDLIASMMINAGVQQTSTPDVTLTLVANSSAGVSFMQFSNDGVKFSAPEKFASSKSWTLSSGDGLKTVHVKFTDGLGTVFAPVSATITLNTALPGTADTTAPTTTVSPVPGTYSGKVTVTLMANEAASIHYTTNGTTPTASSPAYSGSFELAASATTAFNVQFFAIDSAGNSEQVKSAVFTVHVSDLTGSVSINNGEPYAASTEVTLKLSAQDPAGVTRMQFSNDGNNYSPLEPYATSKTWTLNGGDGVKTVFVRFEDGTGTLYTFSASTMLSTTGVANGDMNGDKTVDLRDALRAMQIAIGLSSPTMDEMIRGDVAPLVNGKPKPDGKIDVADAMIMLQRSLGLVTW